MQKVHIPDRMMKMEAKLLNGRKRVQIEYEFQHPFIPLVADLPDLVRRLFMAIRGPAEKPEKGDLMVSIRFYEIGGKREPMELKDVEAALAAGVKLHLANTQGLGLLFAPAGDRQEDE